MSAPSIPSGGGLRTVATAGLVGVAGFIVLLLAPPAGSLDDVFVVLADARGWLEQGAAQGGVHAPGSAVSVESSTSPVDVLLKAAMLLVFPGADPLRGAGWLALLELASFVVLSVLALRALRVTGAAGACCALGMVTTPGLIEGAAYRLEGPLFGVVWLLLVASALEGRSRWSLAWAALLAWIRPEGMILGAAAAWLARPADRRGSSRAAAACLLVTFVPVTLYRWLRYGALAPNTYFAKRSDLPMQEWMDGSVYAMEVLLSAGGVALVVLAGWTGWCASRGGGAEGLVSGRPLGPVTRQGVALTLAALALLVLVASGGDSYAGARLALPVGLPVWLGWACCQRGLGVRFLVLSGMAAGLQIASAVSGSGAPSGDGLERLGRARGGPVGLEIYAAEVEALEAAVRALDGEVIGHRHLQRLRWFSPEAAILDLTGLRDPDIARLPAPGQVTFGRDAVGEALRRRVGALHLDPVGVRPAPLCEVPLVGALSDPGVAAHFGGAPFLERELARRVAAGYVAASRPVHGGYVNLLVRSDLAPRFRAEGFIVPEH
ncbi:MAG: hypothetical protein P8M11_06700 [Planctomycetota bacterium]|nr:hypothetical protein [Planctomycetota bacterium]